MVDVVKSSQHPERMIGYLGVARISEAMWVLPSAKPPLKAAIALKGLAHVAHARVGTPRVYLNFKLYRFWVFTSTTHRVIMYQISTFQDQLFRSRERTSFLEY